ncbi:hypothetical protein IMSAG044_00677 [Lactobacillaceae bacterium]|nr:hypothetical protein IMSAG044_00677 [Lactobacillaceae bacterium]
MLSQTSLQQVNTMKSVKLRAIALKKHKKRRPHHENALRYSFKTHSLYHMILFTLKRVWIYSIS